MREHQLVIGPLAWSEAKKVGGLTVDQGSGQVHIDGGDPRGVIDKLVG